MRSVSCRAGDGCRFGQRGGAAITVKQASRSRCGIPGRDCADDLPAFLRRAQHAARQQRTRAAVCRRILEQHGGSITARAVRSWSHVPAAAGDGRGRAAAKLSSGNVVDHAEPAGAGNEAAAHRRRRCRMRAAWRRASSARLAGRRCVNGTEALDKFRAGQHSLVITDVRMPAGTASS